MNTSQSRLSQSRLSSSFDVEAGMILAAGRSERMGRTKALLSLSHPHEGNETFVARALRIFSEAGVNRVVVVTNPETRVPISAACPSGTAIAVNPRPEDGMISSIQVGLKALTTDRHAAELSPLERVVVTLVDIPEIDAGVVRALLNAPTGPPSPSMPTPWIALPHFDDGVGHPLLLYRAVFPHLTDSLPRGLKSLMESAPERIVHVTISGHQPWDVDTPEDYRRYQR